MSDVAHLRLVVVGHCVRDERRKWTLWVILLYQKKKFVLCTTFRFNVEDASLD